MKKLFILSIIIVMHTLCASQNKYGQTWMMGGYGVYAKFTNNQYAVDTTIVTLNSQITSIFYFNKTNLCDTNGNIQLISDGMNIYNIQGYFIDGGDTLSNDYYYIFQNGHGQFSQTGLFLPMENGECYFVNTTASQYMVDSFWNINYLHWPVDILSYSVIDLYANNGAGKVTKKMVPIMEDGNMSKVGMMACKHGDGKDWWLLKTTSDSNNIYTFLVTQDSIYNKGIQRMPFPQTIGDDLEGQMTFDTAGKKMATIKNDLQGNLYVADFDRCYGVLSNYQKITVPAFAISTYLDSTTTGLCFSPNGRFIYVAKRNFVLQYDLINHSWYKVCGRDTSDNWFMEYSTLELAPDGKIYIGNRDGFSKQMSVIDNPNGQGPACDFCRKCFRVNSTWGYLSNGPSMPNYGLGAMPNCWPLSSEQLAISSEQFEVYPNPSSTIFEVRGSKKGSKKELYNSIGQLVLSTKENEIDVHN